MKIAFDPQIVFPQPSCNKENADGKNDPDGLKQVCREFESVFINTLFREMRKTIPDEGFFGQGMDKDLYQEMMDMEIAREMSKTDTFGLGKILYEQLKGNKQGDAK